MTDYCTQNQEVACCTGMGAQRATFDKSDATTCATRTQPGSLKALSLLALQRNQSRNSRAINDEKARNFDPEKTPEKLRGVAQVSAWLDNIGEPDKTVVQEILDRCRTDPEALAYYLAHAEGREPTVPTVEPGPAGSGELWVLCWTLAGSPLRIRARDAEHAEWLRRMNPPPKEGRA